VDPGALDEQVAAGEAGKLGVADDSSVPRCRRAGMIVPDPAALDDDRMVARRSRGVGGGGDVDPLAASGGGEVDPPGQALALERQRPGERPRPVARPCRRSRSRHRSAG
jgi:hypothetical protein